MNTKNKSITAVRSGSAVAAGSSTTAVSGAATAASAGSAVTSPPATQTRPPKGFRLKLQSLLAGVQTVLPAGSSIAWFGSAMSQSDIEATLNGGLAAYGAIAEQETALVTARNQLQAQLPLLKTFCSQLKVALVATFGENSPQLTQFGLKPKAKVELTVTQKMARLARSTQTRAMRGTQGKKQKAAVKYLGPVAVSTTLQPSGAAPATSSASGGSEAPAPAVAADSPPVKPGA